MCTLVILRRPDHRWPVLIGANRDEMIDRPWKAPGRHWPDRPEVVGGLDLLAGGSWLGVNDWGVAAAVLNRHGSLGPAPGRRSRGELVLEALDHADAQTAAQALAALDPGAYRAFNLLIADYRDAFWLRNLGHAQGWIDVTPVPAGVSMLTAHDLNDTDKSLRIRTYLPRFAAAPAPDPERDDWTGWEQLLASGDHAAGGTATDGMAFTTEGGFATVSSSLLALPATGSKRRPVWRFAAGRPGAYPFEKVDFS